MIFSFYSPCLARPWQKSKAFAEPYLRGALQAGEPLSRRGGQTQREQSESKALNFIWRRPGSSAATKHERFTAVKENRARLIV